MPIVSFGFVLIGAVLTGAYQFWELEKRVDGLLPEAVAAAEAKAREVLQNEAGSVLFGPIGKEQRLKLPDDGSQGELVLDTSRKEGFCFLTRIKGNIFDHSTGRENVRVVMVGDAWVLRGNALRKDVTVGARCWSWMRDRQD
ncbi:MAG: hypothetical protein OXF68_04195 [Gammaproteobacteria bacterium]|nr:hypothetical protein [Gammaproteobacteria bacterium]